ncbi:hypothetical protein L7F22_046299 [Adiantum nelumboides]|nr:hypothetical protein [Adiantum nelumboides]
MVKISRLFESYVFSSAAESSVFSSATSVAFNCADAVAIACSLKICKAIGATYKGKEMNKQGLMRRDAIGGNIVLNMYVKCGFLMLAKQVFEELPIRDDVFENIMLDGYGEHGPNDEALKWLDRVRSENISPTAAMFVSTLKACSTIRATNKAEELHAEIESLGLLGRDLIVGNALLGVYVANDLLARSEDVFGKLGTPDVVSWTT